MLVCTLEKYITLFIVLVLLDYFHILEIEESWKYRHHKNFAFLVKFWRELRWILCLVRALILFFFIRANVLWALPCNCTCSCIVLSLSDLFMHSAFLHSGLYKISEGSSVWAIHYPEGNRRWHQWDVWRRITWGKITEIELD